MIRICYVQVLPIMSGAQRSMLETLRHLDRERFEPVVVCQSEGPLTDELKARGIAYQLVGDLGRDARPWKDLHAYIALKRLFQKERYDIVHNQSAKPRVVATLAARHARVPVVINHVRGYSFHEYMRSSKRILFERMEAWAARRCEATVFVNNEDRQYAVQSWKVPAAKCHTVYNGADLAVVSSAAVESRRQRFRAQYGWDENEVIVAVLGRLDDQKQPLIVPRIARRLASYHLDKPWRIVVAGDGRLRQQLEVEITQYDLSHRVKLIGWQESPVDVLHASDILLLPSLWEGLPRVLIEAHAAGLPCVASRIRGNREVVSKETGILVDPQSVTDYAAALTHLIENKLERARLGRLARIRAELLFDSQRNNAAMIRLYYKLLQMPIQDERRVAA